MSSQFCDSDSIRRWMMIFQLHQIQVQKAKAQSPGIKAIKNPKDTVQKCQANWTEAQPGMKALHSTISTELSPRLEIPST